MQHRYTSCVLLLLTVLIMHMPAKGKASTAPQTQAVERVLALHDVTSITNAMPEIQALWPEQPQAYTECVKHAVDVLAGAPACESVTQAVRRVFASVCKISTPADREDRPSLLRMKCGLILWCLNAPAIRDDVSTWFDIASVVGEVRLQIIPDYQAQRRLNLDRASTLTEAKEAIAEDREREAVHRWQLELVVTDRCLSMFLARNIKDLVSKMDASQRKQVVEKIRQLARLNDEESHELGAIRGEH